MSLTTVKPIPDKPRNSCRATVSFVIPAWNEEQNLRCCLASIQSQAATDVEIVEIIVVDNQSTDGTAEVARTFGARVLTVPPGRASMARNAGALAASGTFVAFIDADCELATDWLTVCGIQLIQHGVAAVGAVMRCPAADATWVEKSWYAIAYAGAPRQPSVVRWLPSFNLLVRRDLFLELGGFDERLTTCEDCELSFRLSVRGALVLEPRSPVRHHGESKTLSEFFHREAWRSRGNLGLLARRRWDMKNWVSALLPVASLASAMLAMALGITTFLGVFDAWKFSLICFALSLIPFLPVVLRGCPGSSIARLPSKLVVFAVYLTARAVGLLWPAARVVRRTSQ